MNSFESYKGAALMSIFCLLAGAAVFGTSFVIQGEERLLANRGVRTQGTVVRHFTDRGMEDDSSDVDYYLEVDYAPAIPPQRFPVRHSSYLRVSNRDPVEVLYDPQNPRLARLTGDLAMGGSRDAQIFSGILAAIGVGLGVYSVILRKEEAEPDVPSLDEALRNAKN